MVRCQWARFRIDYLPVVLIAPRGAFLFATIGITASDFFCPNLATVADRLGMAESTAGVTFLAFGWVCYSATAIGKYH